MANKPRIRFRGFTEDWEQRKLNDFGIATGGTSIESEFVDGGDYKVISIGSYSEESVYNDQGLRVNKSDKTKSRILNKDDLTMILNDKTVSGNIIGRVLLIDQDNTYVYNQRTERIEVDRKNFLPIFLYHMLNAPKQRKYIVKASQGNTQIYVNWSTVSNINYMIPKLLLEQEKIAKFFSLINKDITLHQHKLEKLKLTKNALLQKLFPQNGSKLPGLRFKGVTDAWEQRKLGDLLILLKDGSHGTHKNTDEGVYLLSAKNIKNGQINIMPDDRIISWEDYDVIHKNYELQFGDILLTIVGSIGETAIYNLKTKVTFQRSVAFLRPSSDLNNGFLYTLINTDSFQNQLQTKQVVSAQPGIYLGDLASIDIIYPKNLSEQEKIYSIFKEIENSITLHQRKLERLQEVKKGLLQKMFV